LSWMSWCFVSSQMDSSRWRWCRCQWRPSLSSRWISVKSRPVRRRVCHQCRSTETASLPAAMAVTGWTSMISGTRPSEVCRRRRRRRRGRPGTSAAQSAVLQMHGRRRTRSHKRPQSYIQFDNNAANTSRSRH